MPREVRGHDNMSNPERRQWSPACTHMAASDNDDEQSASSTHTRVHTDDHRTPACTHMSTSEDDCGQGIIGQRYRQSEQESALCATPGSCACIVTPSGVLTFLATYRYLSGTFRTCQLSGFWHFSALSTTFASVCKHVVTWGGVCVYFLKCARKRRFRNVWVWGGGLDIFQGSTTHRTVHTNTALHRLSIFIQNHCHCQHCFFQAGR